MVNLRNLLGLAQEPHWERMDWLPPIPKNQEDEEAMREWRCRTNISIILYNLELREREEYFKKHGALLQHLLDDDVCIRKGKRSTRKKRRFTKIIPVELHTFSLLEQANTVLCINRKRCEGMCCDQEDEKPKKKIKNNMAASPLPYPPPVLPIGFKNYIKALGGSEVVMLVIQKPLFKTDVSRSHNRFSIPFSQVKNEFRTEEEKKRLDEKYDWKVPEIEAILIEPSLTQCKINLRKWDMAKSKTYVLVTSWYSVVSRNRLRDGMVMQLWSFRVGSQLGFALVQL